MGDKGLHTLDYLGPIAPTSSPLHLKEFTAGVLVPIVLLTSTQQIREFPIVAGI